MNINTTKRQLKILSAVFVLTALLSYFFYAHETLPKPLRAATALFETPVAAVSGISYYTGLGIPVYDTPWAVILANLLFSIAAVLVFVKITDYRRKSRF